MDTPATSAAISALLRQLTPAALRDRLNELEAERKALQILLRSAAARERVKRKGVSGGR